MRPATKGDGRRESTRRARIVYHGDANLNQNGRLSSQANADGTVTTDFDRLTANLWAWIVEQVCGQE